MTPCPSCGAPTATDGSNCQDMWNQLLSADFSDFRRARYHRWAVDIYSMQHPEQYCESVKSFAAHLTGMCSAMEHGGDRAVNAGVQRWLSHPVTIGKPVIPTCRGTLTIAHVHAAAEDHDDYVRRLGEWSEDVWSAYADHHDLARTWIGTALGWSDEEKR